jgi:hypothetical protein
MWMPASGGAVEVLVQFLPDLRYGVRIAFIGVQAAQEQVADHIALSPG